MKPLRILRKIALLAVLCAWTILAFWTFSLGYSSSFFQYNLPSRLPPFLAALLGAIALPVGAWFHWARVSGGRVSPAKGWLHQCLTASVSLLPLVATAFLVHHAPEPFRPSADDAMGTGIDFMILLAAVLAWTVLFGLALLVRRAVHSRRVA